MLTPAEFLEALKSFPAMPKVFNPWQSVDPVRDIGPESPEFRSDHLLRYLSERTGRAKLVLCAEALSYIGGHFSGIAMTSERMLIGNMVRRGILADDIIVGGGRRTSKVTELTPPLGATEKTATVVWGSIKLANIDPRRVVLWNAFAFHPMNGEAAWATNRRPSSAEQEAGRPLLRQFMDMFPDAKVGAVGNVAKDALGYAGVQCEELRHPSFFGAAAFRTQVAKLLAAIGE